LGNNWLDAVHEEDKKIILSGWMEAVGKQETSITEYRFIRPDGSIAWVMGQAMPERNQDNEIIGYVGTGHRYYRTQTTGGKATRGTGFFKRNSTYRQPGTYSFDIVNGKWTASELLEKIFGIDADYEKRFHSWQSIVHPDWQKMMYDYFTDEVIGNKTNFDKEYKIIRVNDKAERWLHGLGRLKFNEKNQPVMMLGTIQDITERKEMEIELTRAKERAEASESKFRNYLTNAPDGIFVADEMGNYLEVNPAAITVTGYSREKLLTMSIKDLTPPDSMEAAFNHFNSLLKTGISKGNVQFIHNNGSIRWWSVEAVKISANRFLGFVKDITERIEAEEAIRKSNERFELIARATNDVLWDWDLEPVSFGPTKYTSNYMD
jgi:PAS domain S-box-containing protein